LKGCSLMGVFWGSWCERCPEDAANNMAQLASWHASAELKPVCSQTFPLAQTAQALAVLERREAFGKVVVVMGENSRI
ncbi:MAG: hypothetical protein SGPRY_014465, partial [Prymnesium sp.]